MFEGFTQHKVKTAGAHINFRSAGQGPPLLLLHGYPQTHVMWHRVAPDLARRFTVIVPVPGRRYTRAVDVFRRPVP